MFPSWVEEGRERGVVSSWVEERERGLVPSWVVPSWVEEGEGERGLVPSWGGAIMSECGLTCSVVLLAV